MTFIRTAPWTRWLPPLLLLGWPLAANASDEWFGQDKALHFGASAVIASTGYAVTAAFTEQRTTRVCVGALAGLTAGTAKELYDLAGHGTPSWKDFTWDLIGTGTGVAAAWLVDRLLFSEPAPHPQAQLALHSGGFALSVGGRF